VDCSYTLNTIQQFTGIEQDAIVKAASVGKNSKPSMKMTLKRKVGYIDEEVSVTRTKLAQMEIAEASLAREQEGDAGPSRSD